MSGEPTSQRQTSAVVPVGPDGRILLLLRDDRPEIGSPNLWSTLGGHVEEGETPEEAAWREVEEEVGVRPPELLAAGFTHVPSSRQPDVLVRQHLFVGRVPWTLDDLILAEGQCVDWFTPEQVSRLPTSRAVEPAVLSFLASPLYRRLAQGAEAVPAPSIEPMSPELPARLGIRPGGLVALHGATAGFVLRLRHAAVGARLTTSPGALERPDVTLWWPRGDVDAAVLTALREQVAPGGVLWVMLPAGGAPLHGAEELRRLARDLGLVEDATVRVTGAHEEIGFRVLDPVS
jgi:8-oxo-dGTP diphosphatase